MNLGERIYQLRTAHNLSQGDLADALDVSRQSVSKWENNSAVPELEKLIKLAQIFDITIDELVTGEPTAPPPPQPDPTPDRYPVRKIVGITLLAFGLLCFLVFTVVGIFTGAVLLGLFIATPLILCGVICLCFQKHLGLLCGWAVYLPLWFVFSTILLRTVSGSAGFFTILFLAAGIALTAVTMFRFYTGKIMLPLWSKLLLTVLMLLMLTISVIGTLPPSSGVTHSVTTSQTVIIPSGGKG